MKTAKISVIIPVYNAEKYLAESIRSVLDQTLKPTEIIVVDDCSTDKSLSVAKTFGETVAIIQHENNKGCGAARNTGVSKARGDFLAFLDADDLWPSEKLEKQLEFLNHHTETDMVLGNVEQFISPELPPAHQNKLKPELTKMPGYVAGTLLLKTNTFNKVGEFNEKLELGEFIDWFDRAKHTGISFYVMDQVLLKRRIHTTNMGVYKKQHLKDYTSVLREALARKRNAEQKNN